MKTVLMYVGPMWAGKTTALIAAAEMAKASGYRLGIFDHPNNTRNSERDLLRACNLAGIFCKEAILAQPFDMLIFDEVHFYSVFGNEQDLIDVIDKSCAKVILLAGIEKDFYNDFLVFPVWKRVEQLDGIALERREMYPLQPCYNCGKWVDVKYTVNVGATGATEARVGNHYANCCRWCANQMYDDWKNGGK